jgi:hypothetical protein
MENSSFSVKENAGKSFKTFVLTLSISLIVFSGIYYAMTINSSQESFDNPLSDKSIDTEEVKGVTTEEKTVFSEIASKDPGVRPKEVLAGSTVVTTATETTQTTQSATTPQTGTFSVTVGLILSLAMFLGTIIFVSNNPRRLALSSFEKNALKDLEDN